MGNRKKYTFGSEINPLVRGGRLTEHYPELLRYREFVTNNETEDKLLRFAVLMAQPDSPVYKQLNWETRVREACKLVKIDDEKLVNELISNKNYFARRAISKYFVLTNQKKVQAWYAMTCNYQESCWVLSTDIETAKDPLVAVKLKNEIKSRLIESMKELQKLESELFHDEELASVIREEELIETIHYAERFSDEPDTII